MKDKLFKYLALKALLTITLSTLLAAWTFGQNKVVGELHFEGLKRNKQSYLLQQIKTQPGQPVDSLQLDKDIQNLNMLPSVANALYTLTDSADLTHVTFTVEEAITSLPIFNVGLIDENIWFRVGYSSLNFGGVGHQLNASYQYNDRRNNFFLYYKAPVWGQSKWGNSLSLSRYSSLEPLFFEEGAVDYEYEIRNLNVSTSYSFTPNNILELSVGYFIEQYEQSSIQDIVPTPGPVERTEYKSLIKLSHQFRKLKFDYFRINGFQNTAALQEVITFFSENKFLSLSTQFVAHKFVGKTGNLSTRLWFGIASNSNSPFAPFAARQLREYSWGRKPGRSRYSTTNAKCGVPTNPL